MMDFAHLSSQIYRPNLVEHMAAKGEEITDEILLEIFNRISPPLLGSRETAVVVALLSRKRGRRPCRGVPSLRWLSKRIAELDRPDVHESFVQTLSNRVKRPTGFTERERARLFHRRWKRLDRICIIRGLYRDLYRLIEDNPLSVHHKVLGQIEVPFGTEDRRERAATMTQDVLINRLEIFAPTISRIIEIGSMIH